jgi:hypothetical protein
MFLNPFKDWSKNVPTWWRAYNQIKHDRLNNIPLATYETAVLAMVGLHQVIAKSLDCLGAMTCAG